MSKTLRAWYLHGISFEEAPSTLAELRRQATLTEVSHDELLATHKWEHLLQGKRCELPKGWTYLGDIAETRRGIATGANAFFLLPRDKVKELSIRQQMTLPCIGRAFDVEHFDFTAKDFEALAERGAPTVLLNLQGELTEAERDYVRVGERQNLTKRHLLANRKPWYSMEQREVAPVWAAVFGRGDLKFVLNTAGVRSLTNFHCVFPISYDPVFIRALVFCLNMPEVRTKARMHTRIYGGGLVKFEPRDVKSLPVPDLRFVGDRTLKMLADRFCL